MKKHSFWQADMLNGSIVKNLIIFAIPLMASNVLQSLYNMADMIVLGRFAGKEALAAVGATGSTYSLIINVFLGLATGAGVLVAQQIGAANHRELSDTVHTSAAVSVIIGLFVGILGFFLSPVILKAIDTPADVIDGAVIYLRIMFAGIPALTVYNFGAAILRSAGDSRRPLFYLAISGMLNVLLNLVFVLIFNMDVAGVAIATIVSQYVSAVLVWAHLLKTGECYYFNIRQIRICPKQLWGMIRIGIPSGLQMAMFSISNLIIQSAINGFGTDYVAASTTSSNVENLCFISMGALTQAVMVFAGQNTGAGQIKRLKSIFLKSLATTVVVAFILGGVCVLLGEPLMHMYTSEDQVIKIGLERLTLICPLYFICGIYECALSVVRGMGYSFTPMIGAVVGICAFRAVWVYTIFAWSPLFSTLLYSYPVSWGLTFLFQAGLFVIFYNQRIKKQAAVAQIAAEA